jgi:hypothetical protein
LKTFFFEKIVDAPILAVEKFMNEDFLPNCGMNSCQKFRDQRFWNEQCDNVLKANLFLFYEVYNIYAASGGDGKRVEEDSYQIGIIFIIFREITDDEFLLFVNDCGIMSDSKENGIFTERDAYHCFYSSMMTQIDEISSLRHMQMRFLEFLEAIARVAEIISFAPNNAVWVVSLLFLKDFSKKKSEKQLLAHKIENFLPVLLRQTDKSFQAKYTAPKRDAQTGLLVVNKRVKKLIATFRGERFFRNKLSNIVLPKYNFETKNFE